MAEKMKAVRKIRREPGLDLVEIDVPQIKSDEVPGQGSIDRHLRFGYAFLSLGCVCPKQNQTPADNWARVFRRDRRSG